MPESYGITEENLAAQDFLAGNHPVVIIPVVIEDTVGVLTAGRVLGRNSTDYKYYDWDPDASDGTEVARAILAKDVADETGDVSAIAWIHGEFRKNALGWGTTDPVKIAKGMRDLQASGIYVKADQT
ncbi:head decoration protein [candidate division WOR-3 bacterium]|nr:head decoration protein [candidate division WOR-3 bacterium]